MHEADGGRIRYKRVCEIDGEEVFYSDIGKGYEMPDGRMVILSSSLTGTHDFDLVAGGQSRVRPLDSRHDRSVDGDGNAARGRTDLPGLEESGQSSAGQRLDLTVDANKSLSGLLRHWLPTLA